MRRPKYVCIYYWGGVLYVGFSNQSVKLGVSSVLYTGLVIFSVKFYILELSGCVRENLGNSRRQPNLPSRSKEH